MAGLEKKLMGGALIMLLIMGGMWLTSQFLSGLALTIGNFVVGTVLIIAGLMLVSMYAVGSSLKADCIKNGAGGHMRGAIDLWVIGLIAVLAILGGMGVYAVFVAPHAAPQSPVPGTVPGQAGTSVQFPINTQTLQLSARDFANHSALAGVTYTIYTDPVNGYTQAGNVTSPGQTYTILASKSGYLAEKKTITTSTTDVSPMVDFNLKKYDTSVGISFLASSGIALNTLAANETMTASSPKTVTFRMIPSAVNLFISGATSGKYAVWVNVSNSSAWDSTGFQLVGLNEQPCTSLTTKPAALTGTLVGFECSGDFNGAVVDYSKMAFQVKPSSIYSATDYVLNVCFAGYDYYAKATTPNANSIQEGPVKDDLTAIQALQCGNLYVK